MMERFSIFFIVLLTASLSITTVHNLPYQHLEFTQYPYENANDVDSPSHALPDKPYYYIIGEDNGQYFTDLHPNVIKPIDVQTNDENSDNNYPIDSHKDDIIKTDQDDSLLIDSPLYFDKYPDRFYVPPKDSIIEPTAFEDNGSHRNISQHVDTNANPDDSDRKDQDASSKTDPDDLFSTNSPPLDDSQPNNSEQTLLDEIFLKLKKDDKDIPDKDVNRQVSHVDANVNPDNSAQSDQFDSPENDSSKNDDDDSIQIPFEQHEELQPTSFWGSLWDKVSSFFTSGWNYICRLFT